MVSDKNTVNMSTSSLFHPSVDEVAEPSELPDQVDCEVLQSRHPDHNTVEDTSAEIRVSDKNTGDVQTSSLFQRG